LNAKLKRGIDIVIETTNLEDSIKDADLVFTGEGMIDYQTAFGKTPFGVAKIAKKYNIPVIAIAGGIGKGAEYSTIIHHTHFIRWFQYEN
jgi:glycerate kinase